MILKMWYWEYNDEDIIASIVAYICDNNLNVNNSPSTYSIKQIKYLYINNTDIIITILYSLAW